MIVDKLRSTLIIAFIFNHLIAVHVLTVK